MVSGIKSYHQRRSNRNNWGNRDNGDNRGDNRSNRGNRNEQDQKSYAHRFKAIFTSQKKTSRRLEFSQRLDPAEDDADHE